MSVVLPTTAAEARAAEGTFRAGATDLTELRQRGLHEGPLVDLRDVEGLSGVEPTEDGGLRIGAMTTIARVAADPQVVSGWAGLALAAGGLATPQIRAQATLGGGLLQQVRCWYYRSSEFECLKKGGATCFARTGDAMYHSVVDLGPCIAPHPSTLACALLAYDARAVVDGEERSMADLLGSGSDPRQTHALGPRELLEAIVLPPPVPGEQGAYFRAIHRARAEWPLVECVVRVGIDGEGRIDHMAIALGGVANRPLSFPDAGQACVGLAPDDPKVGDILGGLVGTDPDLDDAAYKALLVPITIRETLERAMAGPKVPAAQGAEGTPGGAP